MAYVVIEKAGSRTFPIIGPFPTRGEADAEAEKQSPRHDGTITVKSVRQTARISGLRKTKSRRVGKTMR